MTWYGPGLQTAAEKMAKQLEEQDDDLQNYDEAHRVCPSIVITSFPKSIYSGWILS